MKIMCLVKIRPLSTLPFAPIFYNDDWYSNLLKNSSPYIYDKVDFHLQTDILYQPRTIYDAVLLFDSEEELNSWADNCRLTDPLLIADQEMWKKAHGITITYEYYLLSPTTGPDPVI